jgi:hypothetical protein
VKLAKPGGRWYPLPSPARIGLSLRRYEDSRHPARLVLQTPGSARSPCPMAPAVSQNFTRCCAAVHVVRSPGTATRSAYRRIAPVRDLMDQPLPRTARHQSRHHYHRGPLRRSELLPSDYAAVVRSEALYACAAGGRHDWHRRGCHPRGGRGCGGIRGYPQAGSCWSDREPHTAAPAQSRPAARGYGPAQC